MHIFVQHFHIMQKRIASVLAFSFILFFFMMEGHAAGPPMGPPMGPPPCWPPPCTIPIDGGISFLIAAGAALAGKKFYDFRKK